MRATLSKAVLNRYVCILDVFFYSTCMQAWGAVNYHNAVVISREPGSPTDHNEEASKVKKGTLDVYINNQ